MYLSNDKLIQFNVLTVKVTVQFEDKVTVQFETEGNSQNEIVSHVDISKVKL